LEVSYRLPPKTKMRETLNQIGYNIQTSTTTQM